MASPKWGSFPSWWVLAGNLPYMRNSANNGRNMAALRVYLALALLSDFTTRRCEATISDLEEITGLSRPMVISGLRVLEGFKALASALISESHGVGPAEATPLIITERAGRRAAYTMMQIHVGFAKVPKGLLWKELRRLPKRGATSLDALKLYLVLTAVRPNTSWQVKISHTKLVEYTGIRSDRLRSAIDILFEHRLIHLERAETSQGHPMNIYKLLGLNELAVTPAERAGIRVAFQPPPSIVAANQTES